MYDQALADFTALRASLGTQTLTIRGRGDAAAGIDVDVVARDLGVRRLSGDLGMDGGSRARLAMIHLAEADVLAARQSMPDAPGLPSVGDRVELWGEAWQVRTVQRLGYARPGIIRLDVTCNESRRGGR